MGPSFPPSGFGAEEMSGKEAYDPVTGLPTVFEEGRRDSERDYIDPRHHTKLKLSLTLTLALILAIILIVGK